MVNENDLSRSQGLQIRVRNLKSDFLSLNKNICCWYSKEPSQCDGSFEHPKHMLQLMGKKNITILLDTNVLLNRAYIKNPKKRESSQCLTKSTNCTVCPVCAQYRLRSASSQSNIPHRHPKNIHYNVNVKTLKATTKWRNYG